MDPDRREYLKRRSDAIATQLGTKKSFSTHDKLKAMGVTAKRRRQNSSSYSSSLTGNSGPLPTRIVNDDNNNNYDEDEYGDDVDGEDFDWDSSPSPPTRPVNIPQYISIIPQEIHPPSEDRTEEESRRDITQMFNETLERNLQLTMTSPDDMDDAGETGSEDAGERNNTRVSENKDCFLCEHFSPDSDNHAIRSMWDFFWANFWIMGFQYLAKRIYSLYLLEIYYPEMRLNQNERKLKKYCWQDFYRHIVDPDCMGCHPAIALRKLMIATLESASICEDLYRQSYQFNGEGDYRAMEGARRDRKFLLDIYNRDPSVMLGYSENSEADASRMGSFARKQRNTTR